MKSVTCFAAAIAFAAAPISAYAEIAGASVMDIPPRFLVNAYAALEDGFSSSEYMHAISRTDLGALRTLIPQQEWDNIYDHATFRGWLTIRQDIDRALAQNPDHVGANPNDIDMLTLFETPHRQMQHWRMIDEGTANSVFEAAAARMGNTLNEEDLIEVRRWSDQEAPDFFVRRDAENIMVGSQRTQTEEVSTELLRDPDLMLFYNSYSSMINAAKDMVPEDATIIEVSVRSWGNRTPNSADTSFPQNITRPVDSNGDPLIPLFGFAVVDWRVPGPEYGVTLAINHFDACGQVANYPIEITETWNSLEIPHHEWAGEDLFLEKPFERVINRIDDVAYCSTVATAGPAPDRRLPDDSFGYINENPLYRMVNRRLFNEFAYRSRNSKLFELKW